MSKKNKIGAAIIALSLIVFNQLLLFYVKYRNQEIPVSQLNFFAVGNILNLLFTIILILGIITYSLKKNIRHNSKIILNFSITISVLLIIAAISTLIPLKSSKYYILDHPINKIIIGGLFFLYQFVFLVFILLIWLRISGRENLFLNSILDSFLIMIGLLIFTYLYSLLQQRSYEFKNKTKSNESVGVVLGAAVWSHNQPSPSLEARAEKAIELYKKGIINHIQLTGGNAPGELSEARSAFNFLLKKGIDPENIWIEEKTTSTSEQIHFLKYVLLKKRNIDRIILISDVYHLVRAEEICKFYNLKAFTEPSDIILSTDAKILNGFRESVALLTFWLFAL
jgi:vancomycin permeability regulator SanA